jgi:hypothetical protein
MPLASTVIGYHARVAKSFIVFSDPPAPRTWLVEGSTFSKTATASQGIPVLDADRAERLTADP